MTNDKYLSITDNAALSTGDIDFSVLTWVYFDSVTGDHGIMGKGSISYPEWAFQMVNGTLNFIVTPGSGAYNTFDINLVTGTWYFIYGYHDLQLIHSFCPLIMDNNITSYSGKLI